MAVHKVPQDVEADDKFLGPLSFKQFVFFGITLVCLFLIYQAFAYGVPYLAVFIVPVLIVSVALAFPWTKDQPTELWLASRIRFLLVPRRRIWDQEGIEDYVTVTAPKREVHLYTDGLNQQQVKSRLGALASLVDSKGWAAKDPKNIANYQSDRLVADGQYVVDPLQQHDTDDILDDTNSALAQQFNSLIEESEQKRLSDAKNQMQQLHPNSAQSPGQNTHSPWFLHQEPIEDTSAVDNLKTERKKSQDEKKFLERVRKGEQQAAKTNTANATSAGPVDPAIMALSTRDDYNVSTLARQANVLNVTDSDEVVVSLHGNK